MRLRKRHDRGGKAMIKINDFNNIPDDLQTNKIFVNPEKSKMSNSTLSFDGNNNIVFIEDGVNIADSSIRFVGNNSVLFLGASNHSYLLNVSINNQSTVYIGRNNYFNGKLTAITSEGRNIIIGDDCLFSYGICVRVADPHLIYDAQTKERINPSKSVFIGDHVWVGQNAMVLKGTTVGSGSVIGAGAVVSGKKIESNTVYAGNPAKKIKSGIFYEKPCVHQWTEAETKKHKRCDSREHIYGDGASTVDVTAVDRRLTAALDSEERLKLLKEKIRSDCSKNRFFIGEENYKKKSLFKR